MSRLGTVGPLQQLRRHVGCLRSRFRFELRSAATGDVGAGAEKCALLTAKRVELVDDDRPS